jgi:hypothetical protein
MEIVEHIDLKGRKYKAVQSGDAMIIQGPPEGLVDTLGLPEPFATRFHNILYARGILNSSDIGKNPRNLTGALQEALNLDIQRLTEAYFNYEKEVVS